MKYKSLLLSFVLCTISSLTISAATFSPAGRWKTVDDATGIVRSIVEIREEKGVLSGQILKIFLRPGETTTGKCDACEGDLKGRQLEGFPLLSDVKANGDVWDGGHIIDPNNGRSYKVKLSLIDNGQKMEVRGYIGFSLLGRTQVWVRE